MIVPPEGGHDVGFAEELDRGTRAVRTDFKVIPVNEYLGNRPDELPTVGFPFVGRQSSLKTFVINGAPIDDAYLLLTYKFVKNAGHIIKINDRDLPWVDILPSNDATTHLKTIAPGHLVRGVNTFQIFLNGPAFLVYYAVVHWHEQELPAPPPPVHP